MPVRRRRCSAGLIQPTHLHRSRSSRPLKNPARPSVPRSSSVARPRALKHRRCSPRPRMPAKHSRKAGASTCRPRSDEPCAVAPISAIVSCSRNAARATFALNAGLCFVRFFILPAPYESRAGEILLSYWSEKQGPLHTCLQRPASMLTTIARRRAHRLN